MSHQLELTRVFDAEREKVFDAWTRPELMARWFFVAPTWSADAEADLRVGGDYRVTMHTDDGQSVVSHGTYREIVRPKRLVFTWNSYAASETLVTIELQDLGGPHVAHPDPRDAAQHRGHAEPRGRLERLPDEPRNLVGRLGR